MIDKLEIRIPYDTPLGPDLDRIKHDLRRGFPTAGFHPTPHYGLSGDLRPFGIPAIAHLGCKHGERPDHKLELLDTGSQTLADMLGTAERVFRFDPLSAEVMRIDLAADVPNVPVSFFESTVYARYKRSACDIGTMQRMRLGSAEVETVYVGRKPNCIRIYNKPAECMVQYQKLQRQLRNRVCALPFERIFGFPPDSVLTRVERQIAGSRVPMQLATVADVQRNAVGFNPFANLQLHARVTTLPKPDEYGLAAWLQGMKLRELRTQYGMHRLRKFINKYSKGNAARVCEQFAPFFVVDSESAITSERLYAIYQESIQKQLA
jgi:hypothetical protein